MLVRVRYDGSKCPSKVGLCRVLWLRPHNLRGLSLHVSGFAKPPCSRHIVGRFQDETYWPIKVACDIRYGPSRWLAILAASQCCDMFHGLVDAPLTQAFLSGNRFCLSKLYQQCGKCSQVSIHITVGTCSDATGNLIVLWATVGGLKLPPSSLFSMTAFT